MTGIPISNVLGGQVEDLPYFGTSMNRRTGWKR
jgi:hypothetical protein